MDSLCILHKLEKMHYLYKFCVYNTHKTNNYINCFGTVLKDLSKKMVSLAITNRIFSIIENIINLSEPHYFHYHLL